MGHNNHGLRGLAQQDLSVPIYLASLESAFINQPENQCST